MSKFNTILTQCLQESDKIWESMVLRKISNRAVRGWVHPEVELPPSLTDRWNASLALPGSELVLDCRGRRIYRAKLERLGRPHPCFLYLFQNHSVSRALRRPYAFHILRMAEKMKQAGIQTLEVLAALRPRNETLNWHSLLIATEIESVSELPSAGNHIFQVHESAEFDKSLGSLLARELSHFHNRKFVHGDLKTRHILARKNSSALVSGNGLKRFHLVDLEKSRHYPHLPSPLLDILAARDLVQLCASLPLDSSSPESLAAWSQFLSEYFTHRNLPNFRSNVVRRILRLYSSGGGLRQGETLLQNLLIRLRRGRVRS